MTSFTGLTGHMRAIWMICLSLGLAGALNRGAVSTNLAAEHGRVLIAENPAATEAFTPQLPAIKEMLTQGLLRFTGKSNTREAWLSLVSTQDIIGIKVYSAPGRYSGTRPAVAAELIESLLQAGFDAGRILLWDRRLSELRRAGFSEIADQYRVGLAGAADAGYDPEVSYSPGSPIIGRLVFGDLEFGQKGESVGRKSYVSKLLTHRITRIINLTPLLNHNEAGVSGVMYGLATGAVDNTLRFETPERLATAIPEIYALPQVGDRVALNIVDALICQYRGEDLPLLHYATELNELWFSTDPVSLDALAIEELDRHKGADAHKKIGAQIYANAALMDLGAADPKLIRVERLRLQ